MEQNVISPPTLSLLWTKTADDIISPDSTSLSLSLWLQILDLIPLLHILYHSPTSSSSHLSLRCLPPLPLSLSVCLQTSSPAALRPPRALRQHLSPRCRRSASPRRWGSARWGRSPCPKTSSTNRPWRRRRGRTCPTRPTPRGSGAVRCTHFNFPHHTP